MLKSANFLKLVFALIAAFLLLNYAIPVTNFIAYAVDTTEYEEELARKEAERIAKEEALAKLRGDIESITQSGYSLDYQIQLLNQKVSDMENQINQTEADLKSKNLEVEAKQVELDKKQQQANKLSIDVYKNTRVSVVELFLNQLGNSDVLRALKYREYILSSQIGTLKELSEEFVKLNEEKKLLAQKKMKMEIDKQVLSESRVAVESQKSQLLAELSLKNQSQSQLNADINSLNNQITSLQQQIIILKSGGTVVDPSSVPTSPDINASLQGFVNNAPAGSFGVFSFGAYTHRSGMSQWGAQARATGAGGNTPQSAEQIIQAYYPGAVLRKDYPVAQNISVSGYGTMPFETNYMYGISEIYSNWNVEALKVQAIISRTYAILYTGNGVLSICATQQCQVYNPNYNAANWNQAVNETKGWVLVDSNGNPLHTQFSSTNGGWINYVGWDTTDGSGAGNWTARAWDSLAGHPWFYKLWYRAGYSESGDTCGRMGWLNEEEMADILNAWLMMKGIDKKPTADYSRVYSYTSCGGGNSSAYSIAELRDQLINPVTNIYGDPVAVHNDNSGQTDSVYFETNRGSIVISGSDFKNVYNLRSPGNLRIPQSGFSFFNVERK